MKTVGPNDLTTLTYQVALPVTHFGDALKLQFAPKNLHAILGSGLALDSLQVALTASPPDTAVGLTVPFTASSGLGQGLGSLETPGAADEYHFTIRNNPQDVLLETSAAPQIRAELRQDADGALVEPTDASNHRLYRALPPGSYRVVITANAGTVPSYSLPALSPAPQSFGYAIGQTVEPGKVGGVAAEGAGNLETTASKDSYTFSVPTAGESVVFDSDQYSWPLYYGSHLVRLADGKDLGPINGHRLFDLDAGDYRIDVDYPGGHTGTYTFSSYLPQAPQSFGYAIGQTVEPGKVGGVAAEGAGNLETTASKDIYTFSVATPATTVFDGSQNFWTVLGDSHLIEVDTGKDWGPVSDHHEYPLPQGLGKVMF